MECGSHICVYVKEQRVVVNEDIYSQTLDVKMVLACTISCKCWQEGTSGIRNN